MRAPQISQIIRGAAARCGYSMKRLAKETGISYQTLMQSRLPDPGSWRFCEWGAVMRHVTLNESEQEILRKEVEKL